MPNIDELRAMESPTITPAVASRFLGCAPHWLRIMAREKPEMLGFPVCCTSEHRVKIPREPFIRFLGG